MWQRIEGEALHRIAVTVFQQTFKFVRPDYHSFISTAASELLTVPGIANSVYFIFVSLQMLYQASIAGVVDQHVIAPCHDQLGAIRVETKVTNPKIMNNDKILFVKTRENYLCPSLSLSCILSTHLAMQRILEEEN